LPAPDVWGPGPGPWLYAVAFVVYVALGVLTRSVVLNWIVGPLFLLIALYLVPAAARGLRRMVQP
jgi:hypothetical protein